MKTREIENFIRQHGYEKGLTQLVMAHNEEIRAMNKSLNELAANQIKMIDTIANVVDGAGAMKTEFTKAMKKAGLTEQGDGIEGSTQSIGDH